MNYLNFERLEQVLKTSSLHGGKENIKKHREFSVELYALPTSVLLNITQNEENPCSLYRK